MAERLTRNNKVNFYFHDEASNMVYYKLQGLEDILEKYGIESVEELENIFKTHHTFDTEISWIPKRTKNYELMIQIMLEDEKGRDYEVLLEKILSHTKKQLDTWKRACELACNYMCKFVIPCPDIHRKECKSFCDLNKADCYQDYFYQQAKKEGEQK